MRTIPDCARPFSPLREGGKRSFRRRLRGNDLSPDGKKRAWNPIYICGCEHCKAFG